MAGHLRITGARAPAIPGAFATCPPNGITSVTSACEVDPRALDFLSKFVRVLGKVVGRLRVLDG